MEKDIKRKLEKQLELLSEYSNKTTKVKEICSLNKEICRTAEVLFKITNHQIGS